MLETTAFQDRSDIVQVFPLPGDDRTGVSFVQRCLLEHGQTDGGRPLGQGVKRVEVEKVAVLSGGADAQDIL